MTAPHNRCRWFLEGNQCIHDTGHPGPHEAVVPRLVEFHEPFTDDEGEHRPRRGPGPIITCGRCQHPRVRSPGDRGTPVLRPVRGTPVLRRVRGQAGVTETEDSMTGHTWAMREAVAKLVCPTCGAPAGLDCRTRSGNPAPVHRPRYAPLTLAWARGYVEAIRRGDRARKGRVA